MAAFNWDASLKVPAQADMWIEWFGANPSSPFDGSDDFTSRFAEWRCLLSWAVTTQVQAMAIEGWFAQAEGKRFELNIPNFKAGKVGNKTGSVTLSGDHTSGDQSLAITGGSGAFSIGDQIKLQSASHERLHIIIGGDGTSQIVVTPPLRFNQAGGSNVRHRGDTIVTDFRETMLVTGGLSGGTLFPSPGIDLGTIAVPTDSIGMIRSRTIELASSHRPVS